LKGNDKISLSEQELINCNHPADQNGCNDGDLIQGFKYAQDNGLVREDQYQYHSGTGKSYKCNATELNDKKEIGGNSKIAGFYLIENNCT